MNKKPCSIILDETDYDEGYQEGRADVIDEILTHTKTIVNEDGIIFEAVLVKDIKKHRAAV